MICKPCRLGADIQTELQDEPTVVKRQVQLVGELLHSRCHKCDCQHKPVEPGKNVKR